MGSSSSIMRPQELVVFRKEHTTLENVEIPARPESRSLTDRKGFVIYGVALLILLPFLIYCLSQSDIRLLTNPSDSCGNLCGFQNDEIDGVECSGRDFTDSPYWDDGSCVTSCPHSGSHLGYICFDNDESKTTRFRTRGMKAYNDFRNYGDNNNNYASRGNVDFQKVFEESGGQWWKYVLTIFITIGLGILTLVLLRYTPAPLVWGIVIFSMLVLVLLTIGAWFLYFSISSAEYANPRADPSAGFLIVAIFWTIVAVIILIIFIVLFKKIGLVIQLYKEATKVLSAMPMLVFVPILFAVVQIIILGLGIFTSLLVLSYRSLVRDEDGGYAHQMNGIAIFTFIFNLVFTVWSMRLVAGVQFMIISGSASTWYFSKNKDYLDSPICTNFKITFKYHLGTIAFGSFLLTLFSVVKAIIKAVCRNACCRCCTMICCSKIEIVLRFLSENSYIQTGIHGQSFLRSAKRATKLLMANIGSVLAINCVGDFVLGIIIFLVSIIATAISYALFSNQPAELVIVPTLICLVVNILLISIVFASFSTIIDTLFICFCEDSVLNDGISRPYYMSRGLMEFVENSKKIYNQNGR